MLPTKDFYRKESRGTEVNDEHPLFMAWIIGYRYVHCMEQNTWIHFSDCTRPLRYFINMSCQCGQITSSLPFSLVSVFVPDIEETQNKAISFFTGTTCSVNIASCQVLICMTSVVVHENLPEGPSIQNSLGQEWAVNFARGPFAEGRILPKAMSFHGSRSKSPL